MPSIESKGPGFPGRLFLLYVLLYAGQAVYSSYINLYLTDIGLSQSQIGLIVSISTAVLLLLQPLWGVASDRARYKNTILKILYLLSALIALLFYTTEVYWQIVGIIVLFSVFYFPIIALQDNYSLEYLEHQRWDFGAIRMGGTIGYAVTVAVVGFWLDDDYSRIFVLVSLILILCLLSIQSVPKVPGHRRGESKAPFREIFKNPVMVCLITFHIVFALGFNIFYTYFPIYFTTIGGNSRYIGIMLFVSAMSEVPFLLTAKYWIGRFGIEKVLVVSGIFSSLRWFLLFFITNPYLIIAVNLLHGMGFVTVNYCIIVFINTNLPKDLRATGQTLNAVLMTFFARVIFGYIGGLASDTFGVNNLMLVAAIITILSTVGFIVWFQAVRRPDIVTAPKDP